MSNEVFGTAADDEIIGTDSGERISGAGGNDIIFGGEGNDTLDGGVGDDTLIGESQFDVIIVGEGNDLVLPYDPSDQYAGDLLSLAVSQPTLDFTNITEGVHVELFHGYGKQGTVELPGGDLLTFENIYNAIGTDHDDVIVAPAGNSYFLLELGFPTLVGGLGNDYLSVNVTEDGIPRFGAIMIGGDGADTLVGAGHAFSTADYSASPNSIVIDLAAGTASGGHAEGDVLDGVVQIIGAAHDDRIAGDGADNQLNGGGGSDYLNGGAGDDTLHVWAPTDSTDTDADTIVGGEGVDKLALGTAEGNVIINASSGTVTGAGTTLRQLQGVEEIYVYGDANITFQGSDDRDNIVSNTTGDNLLIGNGGSDWLAPSHGDTVEGGAGDDYSSAYYSSEVVYRFDENWGNDVIYNFDGNRDYFVDEQSIFDFTATDLRFDDLTIEVGSFDFTLSTGEPSSGWGTKISDGNGNSVLVRHRTYDSFDPKYPASLVPLEPINASSFRFANDSSQPVSADNLIFGADKSDQIRAGDGGDTVIGGDGADRIWGQSGDDRINGDSGADFLSGGDGADTILGGEGNDQIFAGGDGDDVFVGEGGSDTIGGGDGNDLIVGGFYSDGYNEKTDTSNLSSTVYGGEGDDTIFGGSAKIEAEEIYDYGGPNSWVWKVASASYEGTDENGHNLWGGGGSDSIVGDGFDDRIGGATGNDRLFGRDGSDILYGGTGNDVGYGGSGDDTIFGGDNADYLSGHDGSDLIFGGDGNDGLFSGSGDDTVYGGDDDDTIRGGDGADWLSGGSDDDTISGGDGSDTLVGGFGDDTLTGGADADVFLFRQGHGTDIIRDFDTSEDILDFSAYELAAATSLADTDWAVSDVTDGQGTPYLGIDLNDGTVVQLQNLSTEDVESLQLVF